MSGLTQNTKINDLRLTGAGEHVKYVREKTTKTTRGTKTLETEGTGTKNWLKQDSNQKAGNLIRKGVLTMESEKQQPQPETKVL